MNINGNVDIKSPTLNKAETIKTEYHNQLKALAQLLDAGVSGEELKNTENSVNKLLKRNPKKSGVWQLKGKLLETQGKLQESLDAFKKSAFLDPENWAPVFNIGNLYCRLNNFEEGIKYLQKSTYLAPQSSLAFTSLGRALLNSNRLPEAYDALKKSLSIKPDNSPALLELSRLLVEQNNLQKGMQVIELALKFSPKDAFLYDQKGWILSKLNNKEKAREFFSKAHSLQPDNTNILLNLCNCLAEIGNYKHALKEASKIKSTDVAYPNFLYFKSSVYQRLGEFELGEECIVHAKKIREGNPYYHNMHGVLLTCKGDHENAKKEYETAIDLKFNMSNAHNNLGNYYKEKGLNLKAYQCYFNAFQVSPGDALAAVGMFNESRMMCDWGKAKNIKKLVPNLGVVGEHANVFPLLSMDDDPEKQMERSIKYTDNVYRHIVEMPGISISKKNKKIKVGYFSSDFHDHATLFLMSGLFRHHDHENFEIYCFSYGDIKTGSLRTDIQKYSQQFFDVSTHADIDVVRLARKCELDIAIDLKGYTKDNRSGLFKYRLAPVQLNYLGFPSTMGADFIDYIVADPVVIPPEYKKCYSEKIITLPYSYQPNDNLRRISDKDLNRSLCDLPDDVFVFCCMNNTYKISEKEFEIWARILLKVEKSVLWLQSNNAVTIKNLKTAFEKFGLDSKRIVFAPTVEHSEHLRRLQNADLFMDTFFYNAHTTASDALWAGVPVVTKIGKQFAARVGASLVSAVGLKELITTSDEEYENLIIELATNPEKLAEVKNRLQTNIEKTPLFNTEQYTKHFEIALEKAFYLKKNENKVQDIVIEN